MEKTSQVEKKFLYVLLGIIILITLAIFYPFLSVLVLAGTFAIGLSPVCLWIKKNITRDNQGIASAITVILFLVLLCIPLFFIGTTIFNQIQSIYYSIVVNGDTSAFVQIIDKTINNILPTGFSFDTHEKIIQLFSFLSSNITGFFTYTFNTIIMFILTISATFYLLKDGRKWKQNLNKLSPLSKNNTEEIVASVKNSTNRILRGTLFMALVQGILSWIGFMIFGVPNPALWGVISGLSTLIPVVGTSLVIYPVVLFLYLAGMHIQALGLLLWAFVLVGVIDNILPPYFIAKGSEMSSLFILFSIIGGISLMGPIGIITGPLILSLLYSLIGIYKKEINS